MRKLTKRSAAIVLPVAVLGLAGVAYAANLATSSATLGGGSASVTNDCAIAVSYDIAGTSSASDVAFQAPTSTTPGGYYLKQVELTPSGADCSGANFRITVADAAGNPLTEKVGTFTGTTKQPFAVTPVLAKTVGAVYTTVTAATPAATPAAP